MRHDVLYFMLIMSSKRKIFIYSQKTYLKKLFSVKKYSAKNFAFVFIFNVGHFLKFHLWEKSLMANALIAVSFKINKFK